MKKIFLDDLPKKGKYINWKESKKHIISGVYNDVKFIFRIIDYERNKNCYLTIEYNKKEFDIHYRDLKECKVGNILGIYTSDFKIKNKQIIKDENRNLIITDRKKIKSYKYYQYECNKCGFNCGRHYSIKDKVYKEELWMAESSLMGNSGCACCSSKIVVENINSIYHTDPWMIPYIGEECAKTHTHGSTDKVRVICPDCGKIRDKLITISNIYNDHSIGCQCGDGYSYGHKYIFNLLTQLRQDFVDNYTFNWCKFYNIYKQKEVTGEYDFILEQNKLIIEVDGDFHRKDNTRSGQTKEESIYLDNEKDRLAQEYGYKIIRISDEGDFKKNIIKSDLVKLFDLKNIDWIECDEFTCTNLVKVACKYKRDNTKLTCTDIAKIMGLDIKTINKYLTKGTKVDWCNYDANIEKEKNYKNSALRWREKWSKPIKILDKEMNIIHMFFSASDAEKQSQKLFGINFIHSSISQVCTGKRKIHKGYIFKHATKEEYKKWLEQQNKLLIHNENLGQAI